MKKIKKLSLTRLNKNQLDKQQQQLIIGGGCKCGSCGQWATADDNGKANGASDITGTGTNDPQCYCSPTDYDDGYKAYKV